MIFSELYDWIDKIMTLGGGAGAVYSGVQWRFKNIKDKRAKQRVRIKIVDEKNAGTIYYEICYQPTRSILTRAELKGLIGELPTVGQRQAYAWRYFHNKEFYEELQKIVNYDENPEYSEFLIPVSPDEWAQIDQARLTFN